MTPVNIYNQDNFYFVFEKRNVMSSLIYLMSVFKVISTTLGKTIIDATCH